MKRPPPPAPKQNANWANSDKPSRVTVPERAHPFAKLVYRAMILGRVTYDELEHRSGILRSTIKSWRSQSMPSLTSIEAALGALGWELVAVPKLHTLPGNVAEAVEELGLSFSTDLEALGAAISAAAEWRPYAAHQLHLPRAACG